MSLAIVSAEVGSILAATVNVGDKIYNYDLYADNWDEYLNLLKVGNIIKAWMYYRIRTPEETNTARTNHRSHEYQFRGVYSMAGDGSTMPAFQELLEHIATALRTKPELNGKALTNSTLQIELVENRQFGEVLCHYSEMSLIVDEEEQWTET